MNIDKLIDKLTPESAERIALILVEQGRTRARADEATENKPKAWNVPAAGSQVKIKHAAITSHTFKVGEVVTVTGPSTWYNDKSGSYALMATNGTTSAAVALEECEPV